MHVLIFLLPALSCFGADLSVVGRLQVLPFEARDGRYLARGPGYALSVTSGGAVLTLGGRTIRMSIPGASPKSSLEALDRMPGKANYLLGRDFRASYDLYSRVRWRAVYSGIDVVFRGNQEHLEYDFEIGAERDPGRIRLSFDGIDEIQIDPNGDLVLSAGAIQIHQPNPVAYQVIAGQKRPVDVSYRIDASNYIRFRTGAYDHKRPLVIDPEIVFDKSFGGSGMSAAAGLARDAQGNLYVAGSTNSTDFATVNALQSRLGSAPLLVTANAGQTWTFPPLGPARSVNVTAAAPSAPMLIYAATAIGIFQSADGGTTWTATTNSGLSGAVNFLAVDAGSSTTVYALTPQGVFVSTDGAATWRASTVGISEAGIIAMAAHPTQSGTLFASGQNPPALYRSTNFGQSWGQLNIFPPGLTPTAITGIAVAPNGTVIAASNNGLLISTNGGDSWTTGASSGVQGVLGSSALAIASGSPFTLYLLNASGLQRSTDGGQTFTIVLPNLETANSSQSVGPFAVDPRNPGTLYAIANVYFAGANPQVTVVLECSTDSGQTWSQISLPYPVNPLALFVGPADSRVFVETGTFNNVFVTKWSPDGSQVLYSNYLGGSGNDTATGIAVDGTGSAYVTGLTSSSDFPTTAGAFNTKLSNAPNVFVAKLTPDGSQLVYSTLIGSAYPIGGGIAVDATGNAVITGLTRGNFPVTANAYQGALPSGCATSEFNAGAAYVARVAADGKSLVYSTYFGGSCPVQGIPEVSPATYGTSVALDANGNAWVAGSTLSADFPATSDALQSKFGGGVYDGFLARFNPSGGLGYATYLGGPGYDTISAIAFDSSGNIYLTGESAGLAQAASTGAYQAQANANCPIFQPGPSFPGPVGNGLVLKLDAAAHSVLRLTYLGAPLCLAPSSIAVDSSGEPWIGGGAQFYPSAPPTVSPFEIGIGRGFISKFSADFTQLLLSTYFDAVAGIALDSSGMAYVAGTGPSNNMTATQPVYVAKVDPTPPAISLDSIASFVAPLTPSNFSGVAAGEVIRILGKKMGPASPTAGVINAGLLVSNVAGVEVTFDGTPAPLLSVSAQEIDLVAPFELANKSTTTIQVQYNGAQSNPVQVAVTAAALEILGVFNSDFSPNSASNRAKAGSIMSLYVAGAGQSVPPSPDGQVNTAPLASLGATIQIMWAGNSVITLPVTAAVAAPSLAAGIFQVNFVAPQQSLMGVNLSLGSTSGASFNVWVQ